jgi:sirohydrochlorin ferrochelatase
MPIVANIISWLRAGYPEGVPEVDYMPLFALLGTHLTEDEVHAIADELMAHGDAQSGEAIHAAINAVTQEKPLDGDIARVKAHLAAGGWPLADFRSAP